MVSKFTPLKYPIMLSAPVRIVSSSNWVRHIPFAMLLVDILRPKVFVELGTLDGVSYCAFCQAVKELRINTLCYAVDTWRGDGVTISYDETEMFNDLMRHHDPLYGNFSRLIRGAFDDTVGSFYDGEIDLLHIDGFHPYESVKHDFETWLPKMSKKGVILFHDINVRQKDYGVWKLWDEIKPNYPHFEFMHEHGLGVLAVGIDVSTEFKEMFLEQNEQAALEIRNFFFKMGNVWKPLFDALEKEKIVGAENTTLRAELDRCQIELQLIMSSRTYRLADKMRLVLNKIIRRRNANIV